MTKRMDPITLPPEVLLRVFQYSRSKDLLSIRRCSTLFKRLSDEVSRSRVERRQGNRPRQLVEFKRAPSFMSWHCASVLVRLQEKRESDLPKDLIGWKTDKISCWAPCPIWHPSEWYLKTIGTVDGSLQVKSKNRPSLYQFKLGDSPITACHVNVDREDITFIASGKGHVTVIEFRGGVQPTFQFRLDKPTPLVRISGVPLEYQKPVGSPYIGYDTCGRIYRIFCDRNSRWQLKPTISQSKQLVLLVERWFKDGQMSFWEVVQRLRYGQTRPDSLVYST